MAGLVCTMGSSVVYLLMLQAKQDTHGWFSWLQRRLNTLPLSPPPTSCSVMPVLPSSKPTLAASVWMQRSRLKALQAPPAWQDSCWQHMLQLVCVPGHIGQQEARFTYALHQARCSCEEQWRL